VRRATKTLSRYPSIISYCVLYRTAGWILCCLPASHYSTRWFKYDRDWLCVNKSQFVPVIFEPPCILRLIKMAVNVTLKELVDKPFYVRPL
jgi:hypothetical protein